MRHLIPTLCLMLLLTACVQATNAPVAVTPTATTELVRPTQIAATSPTGTAATAERPFESILSPDGQFIAQLRNFGSYSSSKPPTIDILDRQNSVLWQIPYQGDLPLSMPRPELHIYGWSKDGADLYFYYSFSPDGGDRAFYWTGFDLQKIRVADGHIERVLPEGFVSFAFSPDGTQLAYSRAGDVPNFLYVRNLLTGLEKRTPVVSSPSDHLMVGDIQWSPDGKRLAFQTQDSNYIVQTIYLDIARMKTRTIQQYKVDAMWFEGWTADSKLRFFQYPEVVAIDPIGGETVVIGTPTPYP